MKFVCTNIGPSELGGQVEWQGSAGNFTRQVEQQIKTIFDENGQPMNREDHGHIFKFVEVTDQDRRDVARRQILKFYPEWKQLNIMRSGSQEEKDKMFTFIDACRNWSNDPTNNDPFGLDSLEP